MPENRRTPERVKSELSALGDLINQEGYELFREEINRRLLAIRNKMESLPLADLSLSQVAAALGALKELKELSSWVPNATARLEGELLALSENRQEK